MKLTRRQVIASMGAAWSGATFRKLAAAETGTGRAESRPAKISRVVPQNPSPVCVADFESLAKARLSHFAYEYIASGAADELTVRWNREAFDEIRLRPRVLVDVEKVDTHVTLLGQAMPHPILLAPTARHRLSHPEGEVATAQGAGAAGATFVVSSLSTRRLADIVSAAKAPLWFQLYDLRKERREFVRAVVREAEEAGCRVFVVTVDAPVDGARNRVQRVADQLPKGLEMPYYQKSNSGGVSDLPIMGSMGSFTWEAIQWLRTITQLPIVLKGIMNPDDAQLAVDSGVAGIIVSNHGGRCLDTLPASINALPAVVKKVAGRLPILMDGGIRRGTDVLKALALGAQAVLVGRPYLYGLAANGAKGVTQVIDILREELEMAMALTGRPSISSIDSSVLWK
jgi:4-hydroxymandelate oxidase